MVLLGKFLSVLGGLVRYGGCCLFDGNAACADRKRQFGRVGLVELDQF